jgi:hypothetical protein
LKADAAILRCGQFQDHERDNRVKTNNCCIPLDIRGRAELDQPFVYLRRDLCAEDCRKNESCEWKFTPLEFAAVTLVV